MDQSKSAAATPLHHGIDDRRRRVLANPPAMVSDDSRRFPTTGGWGYAVFNHDVAGNKMVADAATADCGHVCHVAVKSKDYIFHPYQAR